MLPEPYNYILAATSLDFEGSIGLSKSVAKSGTIYYQPRVDLYNTSKELLIVFRDRIGFGKVSQEGYYTSEDRAPAYRWFLLVDQIRDQLQHIQPYLTLKSEQGILVIEAAGLIQQKAKGNNHSDQNQNLDRLHSVFVKLAELNQDPSSRLVKSDADSLYRMFRKRGLK